MSDALGLDGAPCTFVAGFSARHDLAAPALARAFAGGAGFAAADPCARAAEPRGPVSFAPQAPRARPRHFSPADPEGNPTAGWDPLDPTSPVAAATAAPTAPEHVAAAHDAGYAAGLAAARGAMDEAALRDRALLAGLLDRLAQGGAIDRDRLAAQLRDTVMLLVAKVVGEAGVSPELLAGRVAAAVDHLADKAESALLRVNPADVALLDGRLPATVFAAGDAGVPRGSFVLETASAVVEDGPALWLEQLGHAVDRVALPAGIPA